MSHLPRDFYALSDSMTKDLSSFSSEKNAVFATPSAGKKVKCFSITESSKANDAIDLSTYAAQHEYRLALI